MKHTIYIDVKTAVEAGLVGKVKLKHLATLSWFEDWINSPESTIEKITSDGKEYYRLDYDLLKKEMPLLKITTRKSAYRTVQTLCDAGILVRFPNNTQEGKSFFRFGETYYRMKEIREKNYPKK